MLQLIWLMLIALHIGATGVWWWMMPGGFPSSATEFWINQFFPPLIVVVLLVALLARGKVGPAILPAVLAAIPTFWMAFAISSRLTFDASFESAWHLPFVAAFIVAVLWINNVRTRVTAWWLVPLLVIPAAIAGWALPGTQRAPEPSTTPAGAALAAAPSGLPDTRVIKLTKEAQLRAGEARLVVKRDKLIVNVQPLLAFADRSPDRCWVGLAPPGTSTATTRSLTARAKEGTGWRLQYKDESASSLAVSAARDGSVLLDASSRLDKPIFSHVNSATEVSVQGHTMLSIVFSPAPQTRIEAPSSTSAARFAYLDGNDGFHVVQATTRGRGPYTELAAGKLKRGEPLTVTLYDAGKAAVTVRLDDWSAQASTALSPTAGDGLPVNAIELVRGGDADTAPVLLTFSLAATSLGRGTASVGHAAGVYRNRVTVTPAP